MRINKYLAEKKYSTRRGADELIKAGKVTINGRRAVLGGQVIENDTVVVDAKTLVAQKKSYIYYAYHKPVGVVTHGAPAGKKDIADVAGLPKGVFPVGRLDEESYGLIILTNDGRVTDRLLNPKYNHEKEYEVKVNKPLKQRDLTRFSKGIKIEDGITRPAEVIELGAQSFRITLTEGKKHQIRRMVTALGYEVRDLKRIRIMNIELGSLATGAYRPISGGELKIFLQSIGL